MAVVVVVDAFTEAKVVLMTEELVVVSGCGFSVVVVVVLVVVVGFGVVVVVVVVVVVGGMKLASMNAYTFKESASFEYVCMMDRFWPTAT